MMFVWKVNMTDGLQINRGTFHVMAPSAAAAEAEAIKVLQSQAAVSGRAKEVTRVCELDNPPTHTLSPSAPR